jgi:hypothetical protein
VYVAQSPCRFCKAILLAHGEELAFVAILDACVVLGRLVVALGEALASLDDDTHLVCSHGETVVVQPLVDHVDAAILKPLLDFVSLAVKGVRMHSTESLPHAVSAKGAVARVVGEHKCRCHHTDVIGVHKGPQVLVDGEQGLPVVHLGVQRFKVRS